MTLRSLSRIFICVLFLSDRITLSQPLTAKKGTCIGGFGCFLPRDFHRRGRCRCSFTAVESQMKTSKVSQNEREREREKEKDVKNANPYHSFPQH